MTRLATLSHHSLHKHVDNECDLLPCITLAIQPEWLVLVNSIKALWLQWGSWAVQYPCFTDTITQRRTTRHCRTTHLHCHRNEVTVEGGTKASWEGWYTIECKRNHTLSVAIFFIPATIFLGRSWGLPACLCVFAFAMSYEQTWFCRCGYRRGSSGQQDRGTGPELMSPRVKQRVAHTFSFSLPQDRLFGPARHEPAPLSKHLNHCTSVKKASLPVTSNKIWDYVV